MGEAGTHIISATVDEYKTYFLIYADVLHCFLPFSVPLLLAFLLVARHQSEGTACFPWLWFVLLQVDLALSPCILSASFSSSVFPVF